MIKSKEVVKPSFYHAETAKRSWRLKLDKNENIYGVSEAIINTIKNFDYSEISFYWGPDKLLNKLSEKYKRNNEHFTLTNGCSEALNLIISLYLNKDEEILSYNPILSPYIELKSGKYKEIEYSEKYRANIKDIERSISDNTKIIYLSNPNDITGELLRPSICNFLADKYPDILFVINCSYINFANFINLEDYLDLTDKYKNLIIIKSFSHDYALAGLNLSFIYAKDNTIQNIKKISPQNVNAIAIACGCAALDNDKYIDEIKLNNLKAGYMLFSALIERGFKPYESEGNFILCDFYDYTDFYYQKLKNNGVIVKKFEKNSQYSTCLRICIPKPGGVKYIIELLNKKDILIFNPDGVIFDGKESIEEAVAQTFKKFTGFNISHNEISQAKNMGKCNCAWDIINYLLEKERCYIDKEDIINAFIDILYNPKIKNKNFLIDNDKLLISKETLENLSQKYDMVIFTDRLKMHLDYSLKKFEIDKYFHYSITADDLIIEYQKPNPKGLLDILKYCPHKDIKYFGISVDDIIAGNNANIETIGVIDSNSDKITMKNNFKHLGAKDILENINDIIDFLDKNEQK